jgi:hypothetical protein
MGSILTSMYTLCTVPPSRVLALELVKNEGDDEYPTGKVVFKVQSRFSLTVMDTTIKKFQYSLFVQPFRGCPTSGFYEVPLVEDPASPFSTHYGYFEAIHSLAYTLSLQTHQFLRFWLVNLDIFLDYLKCSPSDYFATGSGMKARNINRRKDLNMQQ